MPLNEGLQLGEIRCAQSSNLKVDNQKVILLQMGQALTGSHPTCAEKPVIFVGQLIERWQLGHTIGPTAYIAARCNVIETTCKARIEEGVDEAERWFAARQSDVVEQGKDASDRLKEMNMK